MTLDKTENFGIYSEQWQEGPKLINSRHDSAIVSTKKGLFVIGIESNLIIHFDCST